MFLGSLAKNNTSDWTNLGLNKWATAKASFPELNWRSVGFLLMGEEIQENVGTSVENELDLDQEGEFWWEAENERVILFSPQGNPAVVYGTVEIAHRHSCFLLEYKDYIVIQDLNFKYSNNSAIMPNACNHIVNQNIDASFLGGGRGATSRAGDAIPPHGASSNFIIRDCNISQVYDIGIAPQLYPLDTVLMHEIIVENCRIDKCGAGITIAAHGAIACEIKNVYFRNNIVTNSGYGWSGTDNSVHGKGIGIKEKHGDIKPDVHDIYIENNIIDTYAFRGINAYEGDFVIKGNIIRNGTAEYIDGTIDYPGAIALNGGDFVSANSSGEATGTIAYNLIYDNICHGIFIKHNTPYPFEPMEIYINLLYNNGNTTYASLSSRTSSGTIIKNNIIYSDYQEFIEAGPFGDGTTNLDNNLYYSPSSGNWNWDDVIYFDLENYKVASGQDTSSISSDPKFIDQAEYDFHLQKISPAIDAGADLGLSHDFDSSNVPQGIAPDIGAHEYVATTAVDESNIYILNQESDARLSIFPNPTYGNCTIKINLSYPSISTEAKLSIYNTSAVLIEKMTVKDNEFIWYNADVPSGIYILKYEAKAVSLVQRLLIIR